MDASAARVALLLDRIDVGAERHGTDEWVVRVPSTKRGAITVLLRARERTVSVRAFVLRAPDRNHAEVYRRLLGKNLATRDWRYGVDDAGDIFAAADAHISGLDATLLDGLLGALCALVDETYESLVRIGFDVPEGTVFGPPPGEDAP